tara:strand:- start:270 stop:1112 length:843 start_codon:yes stop_codon:yes gene_type:complete
MEILSIDVGIKNLAYTIIIFDASLSIPLSIKSWGIINLCKETINCSYVTNKGICKSKARYGCKDNYYCKTHAKKSEFFLPADCPTLTELKKYDLSKLQILAKKYNLNACQSKTHLAKSIKNFYSDNVLKIVNNENANTIELPELARSIMKKLDAKFPSYPGLKTVLIENQISTVASRMKSIQSMLTQYFIMRIPDINVIYVSSINKLKYIHGNKNTYEERKKLSIVSTKKLIENIAPTFKEFYMNSTKQDDLADALLQVYWYLIDKKLLDNIFIDADYLE